MISLSGKCVGGYAVILLNNFDHNYVEQVWRVCGALRTLLQIQLECPDPHLGNLVRKQCAGVTVYLMACHRWDKCRGYIGRGKDCVTGSRRLAEPLIAREQLSPHAILSACTKYNIHHSNKKALTSLSLR